MRDYIKLLDWLRSSQNACYIYGCDECPADCENHEGDIFKEAADAIEELIKTSRRWKLEAAANEKDKQYLVDENRRLVDSLMNLLVQKWISVEERLPEDSQDVLVFFVYGVAPITGIDVDSYNHRAKRWVNMDDAVTHWMPLPDDPLKEVERCESKPPSRFTVIPVSTVCETGKKSATGSVNKPTVRTAKCSIRSLTRTRRAISLNARLACSLNVKRERRCKRMPDILIRGMKMPSKENQVLLLTPDGDVWLMADMPCETEHLTHIKAVELPPHGDLIERDWLTDVAYDKVEYFGGAYVDTLDLAIAPVIVPASEGGANDPKP